MSSLYVMAGQTVEPAQWFDGSELPDTLPAHSGVRWANDADVQALAPQTSPTVQRSPSSHIAPADFGEYEHAPVPLDNPMRWWQYVPGADWRHPEGPKSSIEGKGDHPVVQIAYDDALAYAREHRRSVLTTIRRNGHPQLRREKRGT